MFTLVFICFIVFRVSWIVFICFIGGVYLIFVFNSLGCFVFPLSFCWWLFTFCCCG